MDSSMDARPLEMWDRSYPVDSIIGTSRVSRRYKKPTDAPDHMLDFRRETTDIPIARFASRPRLRERRISPPSTYRHDATFSASKLIRERTSSKPRFCSYHKLCREYVWSLNWPQEYFNHRFNRCYCSQCYPEHYKDVYITAGASYVIPRGWVRFGLYVDDVKANREDLWNTWIVTYHGTKLPAAQSIIAHRQFLLPGDTCDDGTIIGIRKGHIPGKKQVYTSPTIKYSSLDCYCEKYSYQTTDGQCYQAKIVLQCRQQPGTYETQGETVGSRSKRICNIIPNDRIEIFTTVRAAVVPYGLLVQLTPM
ncbi:unnamed protein product [Rotaria sp. Silwood1]|nr:unnamed protein product [Rotaria sp. Silwood1]CAF0985889.1 unnamed protein product [Rotaria sp. Silwood1]CAF0994757.1 unnamed protein product [Rotaria sp. Silwood1]CAF3384166.1 unnamed protein product [Rotaria sp. Silwood1]CAF3419216.1 unnamed protein product [Rotaria sp. Silwood1]